MSSAVVLPSSSAFPRPPTSSNTLLGQRPSAPPPPDQNYADFIKVVLRQRLKHMALLVGLASWGALAMAVFDPAELPGSIGSGALPALLYSPLAVLGALPVLVLRKQTLTVDVSSRSSPLSQLLHWRLPSTYHTFAAYLISGAILLQAYIWCSSSVSSEPQLGLFFLHKGRDAFQLNERWIYLSLLHSINALVAGTLHVSTRRSRVEFDAHTSLTIPERLSSRGFKRVIPALRSIALINTAFFFGYLVFRQCCLKRLILNYAGAWSRPYFYSMMRHNAALSTSLIARGLSSSVLVWTLWEVTNVCFEVYVTQPVSVSHFARKPQLCLLSGLRSSDAYYQSFAFLELSVITLTDASRRKAIFMDIKPDGASGGAWHDISRECLKLIGIELQRAKRKGASPAPAPAEPASSTQSPPAPGTPLAKVVNDNVFRPTKPSLATSLLTSTTKTPTAASTAIPLPAVLTSRIPSIFQTAFTPSPPVITAAPGSVEEKTVSVIPNAWQGDWLSGVLGKRVELKVASCVANGKQVVWAVESLSHLLCASLQEDTYGVAQRDIPKVIEGFVLYLLALESLTAQLLSNLEGSEKDATQKEIDRLITPIDAALRDAVKAVLDEFSPYLDSFAFPPRIANKLQLLVDWG